MTSWQQYIKILHQQHQLSNHAIESANRLLKHEFLFDNPYAMEPTQESYVQHPMDWQVTPNGDPEWLSC
ncbi:hypothetical protein [Lacticaseibacillus saniviri]|uniref:hypothetical protein n=1 Tax=Lacticaseibacillus saniviri TaxID=931533 RepID=UPI00272E18A8|nr:hypothetical protein [Lacticaseibacillus saniviri]